MNIKNWIIKKLGGIPNQECEWILELHKNERALCKQTIDDQTKELARLNEQIAKYDAVSLMSMDELNNENIRVKQYADEMKEFADSAFKAISNGFHTDSIYGFPKSLGYPGSIYGTSAYDADTNQVIIDGRIIFDDHFSSKFESAKSTEERLNILQFYMKKYGLYETIGKTVVRDGAMSLSVGYNENNTAYELYYHMNVPRDGITVVD